MNPGDTYTFSDNSTGVFVQKTGEESLFLYPDFDSSQTYTFPDATDYVSGLSYPSDGGSSWRLPLRLEATLLTEYVPSQFPPDDTVRVWTAEVEGTSLAWMKYLADPFTGFTLTNINTTGICACPVRTLSI